MRFTMVNFVYLFYTIVKGFYLSKLLSVTSTIVTIEDVLVSIDRLQTITFIQTPPYSGRVGGDWDGSSPGQATFTLNSIKESDERFYSCKLSPETLGAQLVYDTVELLVVGK